MNRSKQSFSLMKKSIVFACTSLISLSALADSNLEGRITDQSQSVYFDGAQIKIKELNLSTVSERDGSFRFPNVKQGTYTLQIHYIGIAPVEKQITISDGVDSSQNYVIGNASNGIENIIVYGQIAGQASALSQQKNAENLKSVVSADAIGQFPDQNAAEALQRLPGLFIQKDQGEGRFVGVRGIDPNLNNVSINGVNVPSPEAGVRSVALDVIPSELIQSLEVSKSVTPDMDANAVGGSIEVKSLSAFDREEQSDSFSTEASHNELVSKTSPKISGSFTDKFELKSGAELGVASALSWFKRDFGSHNMETDGGWSTIEVEDSHTDEDTEIFGAEEIEQRAYEISRERLGAALNFDLRTSTTDKYYLRTLYSDFSDDEFRLRNEYKFDKGQVAASSVTDSAAQYTDAQMDRDTKDRIQVQEILSLVAGGENKFDDWAFEYSVGYSKSSETEDGRIDTDFNGEGFDLGYSSNGKTPQLTYSADSQDLTNFAMDEVSYSDSLTEDEEISSRFDIKRYFTFDDHYGEFKFGAKYRSREKTNAVDATVYDGGFGDVTADEFATPAPDYALGEFGQGLDEDGLHDFVMMNKSTFDINQNESDIITQGESYINTEDVFAAYGMVTMDIEDWHIVAGVRYENTAFSTSGNKVDLIIDEVNDSESANIEAWQVDKDYDHLLPSLNVRYEFNDNLVTRFAYTNTIARPTFGDSAAYQMIESESTQDGNQIATERKAVVGNPDLDPYESSNLDFSIEYYPDRVGVISAGLFHKNIANFIEQRDVHDNGQWDGYDEVIQMVNGGNAKLSGVELAWTKTFNNGLLLGLNGTFIDADSQLPAQSDTFGNLMIGYENNAMSARLTATHKSESFRFYEADAAVYEAAHNQLDFSLKYNLNTSMQVSFNAINITDEPYYLYHGETQNNYQYEQYGRSFQLGFTIKSF
ncbi:MULTISPECIES: TonB-dependent receptor [unclassified Pseudoalteromonas]|uniref:TonB-dependent receptor n=1 Tax=unclassified Pseudoalteromonas TaxID=194690 RepID=UPI0005A61C60|nr:MULTISPECIES: TonB-dependent receptor [unclassified Pseudoalteromonas]